jgi:hypothetical protein
MERGNGPVNSWIVMQPPLGVSPILFTKPYLIKARCNYTGPILTVVRKANIIGHLVKNTNNSENHDQNTKIHRTRA